MRTIRPILFAAFPAVLIAACGDDSTAGDAGEVVDDGGTDADADVPTTAPPTLTPCPAGWVELLADERDGVVACDPWPHGGPPTLTPCPDGWREVVDPDDGTATCDPWPETGYEACAAIDEAHFPGEPGCTRVGTACSPDDDWATDLPDDRPIRYVLAGAPAGGDGTRTSPFGTITEAMGGAPSGTIVALSKGTFEEQAWVPAGVTLWGACVAETLVTNAVPSAENGTINVRGRDAQVRNLRVSGRRPGLLAIGRFRTVLLTDVVFDGASFLACYVSETAVVTGRGVVLRNTLSQEGTRAFGRAVEVQSGGQLDLQRAVVERNRTAAIAAFDAESLVRLADTVVCDTRSQERDLTNGRAIAVQTGARLEADRLVVERNRDVGVFVESPGTTARLTDVVVRDTRSQERDRMEGQGLSVVGGAEVEVTRGLFERNRWAGIGVFLAGSTVRLADVVVRETDGREHDGTAGRGINVQDGATLEAERTMFERNRDVGVFVGGEGTTARFADLLVRNPPGTWSTDGTGERGLEVVDGAQVEIERVLFDRNRFVGVLASSDGTTLHMTDVVIRDTRSEEAGGTAGRGVEVQLGARVELTRAVIERNHDGGVFVGDPDTTFRMTDGVIRDTLPIEGAFPNGTGIGTYGTATADLTAFVVSGNALCGIQLARGRDSAGGGGTMDLRDGVVSHNAVCGANVQTRGFDLRRLQDAVLWHDNGIDLDSTEMPVPDPALP